MQQVAQHHGWLVTGSREEFVGAVREHAEGLLGRTAVGDVDYSECIVDVFGVEEGHLIRDRATRSAGRGNNVFAVWANLYTHPAQNALLKLLEEPVPGTYLFVGAPNAERLLPTVRSRLAVHTAQHTTQNESATLVSDFLAVNLAERLAIVGRFYGPDGADRAGAAAFLAHLAEHLHTEWRAKGVEAAESKLRAVVRVAPFLNSPSSSPKLILEHLALIL